MAVRLLCLTPGGEERYVAEVGVNHGFPVDVDVDQAGNAYVTGVKPNSDGTSGGRGTLVKVDANGQVLWRVTLPQVPGLVNLIPTEAGVNPLGVPLVGGYAWQSQVGVKSFVYRINTGDGAVVWSGVNSSANSSQAVQLGNHNDPILAVETNSAIHLTRRDWRTGAVVWSKAFSRGFSSGLTDIEVDSSNNIIVSGTSQSTSDSSSSDWWVFKLDPGGTTIWSRIAGGPLRDFGGQIELGADGSVFVQGSITPTGQTASTRAARFSSLGTQQYFHVFPRIQQLLRTSIDVDGAGNLYLAAADYQSLCMHALSPSGSLLWEQTPALKTGT